MDAKKAKAIRYYLGESQEEFAGRLGVSTSTVCAIEKGTRGISDLMRAKLAKIEMGFTDEFYHFYNQFLKNSI
ncbi:helix-turn-helix domain-containing protein [Cytobacillus horneckiae]|uniref:XRE family transcriptional regulator n=1 Tax=Cytobacillus horneckiae TaxID=549687 RepID=A0A2N0ZEC5_9BACI|nr:helix-turn-helix transcriptional regulator [Cytobacillus horneckiae]MEC1157565.1 helix-turn-helix transcriptional regulator [Cytobacillus horneckiae]MED2939513.1 helix-turn-helix transcriptional regulator [Cytobacillus horneckiae]PKG27843.1 XRE family transcriptional regulator [Cytobacillus horneckiae]